MKKSAAEIESDRLGCIKKYKILDTPREKNFDDLTELAAQVFSVPIVVISVIDKNRLWFKSTVGLNLTQTERYSSFCTHIQQSELFIIEDATQDARFAQHPLVTGALAVRFYAGAPLIDAEGLVLGALCLVDRVPRTLSKEQATLLQSFALHVMTLFDLRLEQIKLQQALLERNQLHNTLIESEERWRFALEGSNQGIWDIDVSLNQIFLSPRCKEMLGYQAEQISADMSEWLGLVHPDDLSCLVAAKQLAVDGSSKYFENEHRKMTADGSWKWILVRGMVLRRDEAGMPLRFIGTYTDINEKKLNEAEVLRLAQFDGITSLPNRSLFTDRLSQEMKQAKRNGKSLALIMLDIDRFKEVNDSLGHQQGDFLLKLVSERLLQCVRTTDTVGRLGGDEFTIILTNVNNPVDIEQAAFKIVTALAEPYQLGGDLAYITVSLGITLYPDDAIDIEELFKNADQAMYTAKDSGRNRHCYYMPSMHTKSSHKAYIASELRNALSNNELSVFYQPIVNLATNQIDKAEALLRWKHPKEGDISPALFIPIAEETGQIIAIGDWVFKQAAIAVKACREKIHHQFQISVNKSPIQFKVDLRPHFSWIEHLTALGLPGESIVIEITEGLLIEVTESLKIQFDAFKNAGIQVALDDFGTGYSSLSYLQQFDVHYLKIDRAFIKNLGPNLADLALCEAIIVMAHKLGMKVIAEGVETTEQMELLKIAGCDYAQGFLFSRAVPLNELHELHYLAISDINSRQLEELSKPLEKEQGELL